MKKLICFYLFVQFFAFSPTPLKAQALLENSSVFNENERIDFGESWKESESEDYNSESVVTTADSARYVAGLKLLAAPGVTLSNLGNTPNINANWEEIGPTTDPVDYPNWLGYIGYIALPDINNNNKIFACSPAGGLFHSTDNGETWQNAGTDKGLPQTGVSSIAFDDSHLDNIWYITTGSGFSYAAFPQTSIGVYRTVDAGLHWTAIGLQTDLNVANSFCRLVCHANAVCNATMYQTSKVVQVPGIAGYLFVAATDGLFVTTNGLDGTSYGNPSGTPAFTRILTDPCFDIEFLPYTTKVIFTTRGWWGSDPANCTKKLAAYIYDWQAKTQPVKINDGGLFFYERTFSKLSAALTRNAPTKVYFLETEGDLTGCNTVYAKILRYDISSGSLTDMGTLDFTDPMALAVSPTNENIIWYGSGQSDQFEGVVKITNALTASNPSVPLVKVPYNSQTHPDINAVVYTANGTQLWVGSDGGISKLINPDAGSNSFQSKNNGLGVSTMYNMDIFPSNPVRVIHGNQDDGIQISDKSSGNWISTEVAGGDGSECTYDYKDYNHYYYHMLAGSSLYERPAIPNKKHYFTWGQFVLNASDPYTLYISRGSAGLYRITEADRENYTDGEVWSNFYSASTQATGTVAVSKNPLYSNYIYVGSLSGAGDQIYKSTVGGGNNYMNWSTFGVPPANLPCRDVAHWQIIVDYYNPDHIWVGTGWCGVYSVNTLTNTWTSIPCPGGIFTMAQDKENYGLYFSFYDGVYYLENGSTTLVKYDGNLPNVPVSEIRINDKTGQIVAGTYGRGAWQAPLACNSTGSASSDITLTGPLMDQYKFASNSITCTGSVINTAHVILRAGNRIDFNPGFSTATNGILNAYVLPCGSLPQNLAVQSKQADDNISTNTEKEPEAISESEGIRVYPNPSTGIVTVEVKTDDLSNAQIEVYDLQGRMIQRQQVSSAETSIDLQDKKGMFIIRVETYNKVFNSKIIVN